MPQSTLQPANTSPAADLAKQVAQVSVVFARAFGARWREQGSDPKTLQVWERAFEVAGLTAADVARGLRAAVLLAWPPSAGEFVELCFPPAPDLEAAIAEAAKWAHTVETHDGNWSHPAVGAAARQVGDFALRMLDARSQRIRFEPLYRAAILAHRRGETLDVPARRLRHDPMPGPRTPESERRSRALIADLQRHFSGGPAR